MHSHRQRRSRGTGLRVTAVVLAAVSGVAGGAIVAFFRGNVPTGYSYTQTPQPNVTPSAKVTTARSNAIAPKNATGAMVGSTASSRNQAVSNNQANQTAVADTSKPLPPSVMIQVPVQSQLPQLPNGCEVTSLSMLLTAVGHPVSRFTLANEITKDPTPLVKNSLGTIVEWGNPNVGFVGDMAKVGFAVYHGPVAALINQILPNQAVDLTGHSFDDILHTLAAGTPVEVWTNQYFVPLPESKFTTWQSPTGPVHTTFYEHAVLLVGYDDNHLYIDNPLGGIQNQAVNKQDFIESWKQMGSQAVTVAPSAANSPENPTSQ